ncbi:MAG TPA: hypothetical protein PKA41_15575 [Verrucomicrobiota bacterium]|nr:hypothetical protein [Verrucomicrobiota bacterium]
MRVPFSGFQFSGGGEIVPPVFGISNAVAAVTAGAKIGNVAIVEGGTELGGIMMMQDGAPAEAE